MVASPTPMRAPCTSKLQMADNVAVGIEHAYFRNGGYRQVSLAPRFAQQRFRPEDGRSRVVFAADDRPLCRIRLHFKLPLRQASLRPSIQGNRPQGDAHDSRAP